MSDNFNFDDVFPPKNSVDPVVYVKYLMDEEKKQCGKIDERITTLETEFYNLIEECKREATIAENTKGFWNRIQATRKVEKIAHCIAINRDLRHTLYIERWRRT